MASLCDTFEGCICSASKDFTDLGQSLLPPPPVQQLSHLTPRPFVDGLGGDYKDDLRAPRILAAMTAHCAQRRANNDNFVTFLHVASHACYDSPSA